MIRHRSLRLGGHSTACGYAINYGIKTGLNEAFIIDNETKEALVAEDPRSAEILRPVLRGRDIKRYRAEWQGLWLIATFPARDLNIEDYPAVKRYLLTFGRQRLEQSGKRLSGGTRARKRTGNSWFELQDTCAYHGNFRKEKLFWADMAPIGRFTLSDEEFYCNNKGYIMTGASLKYLCAVLNSSLVTWLVQNLAATTGVGLTEWTIVTVERLPIPVLGIEAQGVFRDMIARILSARDADPSSDTSEIESAIDQRVYELFGLTPIEISAVEKSLS